MNKLTFNFGAASVNSKKVVHFDPTNSEKQNEVPELTKYWGLPSSHSNSVIIVKWLQQQCAYNSGHCLPEKACLDKFKENSSFNKKIAHASFDWVHESQADMQVEVWSHIQLIEQPALQDFIVNVLTDPLIMPAFYRGKASAGYHHNQPGDLFKHSYEVALTSKNIANQYNLDSDSREAAFVGGLIHDIGKIKMFYNAPQAGVNTQHEALNFMVLARHLESLQAQNVHLFEAITNCITNQNQKSKTTAYVIEPIVRTADQVSASTNEFKMAFNNKPEHFNFAQSPTGMTYKRLGHQARADLKAVS